MSPSRETRRDRRKPESWDGGEQQYANGHTGSQSSDETSRQQDDSPTTSLSVKAPSALAEAAIKASRHLLDSQEAIKTLIETCEKHADESKQFPIMQQKFNKQSVQLGYKGREIRKLQNTIDVLEQRNSEREQAAAAATETNLKEAERLKKDKEEFERKQETADKRLKATEVVLKHEKDKELSRQAAEQEKNFQARKEALESEMEKQKKQQSEKLTELEIKNKEGLETIDSLKAQIETLRHQLMEKDEKYEELNKLKDMFKSEKKELDVKLEDLQKEFSLSCKPLEFYTDRFHEISQAIQIISSRYLGRELSDKEMEDFPKELSIADPMISYIPFSNTEPSMQLRIAYAQQKIWQKLHNIIWQQFSSERTAADSRLSEFLEEILTALARSEYGSHGSSRAADYWKAQAIHGLQLLSTESRSQEGVTQELATPHSSAWRVDKIISDVVLDLGLMVGEPSLPQFKADLLDIAEAAIIVWASAQVDERTFIINPILNQKNRRDWNEAALDYDSLYDGDDHQQVARSITPSAKKVFTLFPIIIATKRAPVSNAPPGPPGSWPEQDQQTSSTEITLIHSGLGLPEESEIVQRGIKELDDLKMMRNELEKSWKKMRSEKGRGHSRTNSMAETGPGPSSPIKSWMSNGRNKHATET